MYDRDGNGRAEFATYDEGDDGDFEWILEDQNADGVYEKVFNRNVDQRTPMEKAMQNPDLARAMGRIADMNADNSRLWLLDDHDGVGNDDDLDGRPTPGIAIRRTRTTDFVR